MRDFLKNFVAKATRLTLPNRILVRRILLFRVDILYNKSLHFKTTFVRRVNPVSKLRRIAVAKK